MTDLIVAFTPKEYMRKNADFDPTVPGVMISALLASSLPSYYANKRFRSALDTDKSIKKTDINKLIEASNLKGMPFATIPGMQNAYFSSGDPVKELGIPKTKNMRTDMGYIAFDPRFKKPGVVAHELGHADVHNRGGLSAFNQSYGRPASAIAGLLGLNILSRLALHEGHELGFEPIGNAAVAGLGGAALGTLVGAPTLINERQATNRGIELLKRTGASPEQLAKAKDTTRKAYHTYVASQLAPFALLPAATAYLSEKPKYVSSWTYSPQRYSPPTYQGPYGGSRYSTADSNSEQTTLAHTTGEPDVSADLG